MNTLMVVTGKLVISAHRAVGLVHQQGAVWESITDHTGFNTHLTARTLPQSALRTATVVLVAVVVTVQVSVTAFGCQDAATRPTLEVAGGALVHSGFRQQAAAVSSFLWKLTTVRVLGPLQSHNAEHRLTLLLRITTQRPAGRDLLQADRVTLGHQQRAGVEHEVLVAAGLDQGREQRGLPGHGALSLGKVTQVVWVAGQVVGQVHAQLQADGLTARAVVVVVVVVSGVTGGAAPPTHRRTGSGDTAGLTGNTCTLSLLSVALLLIAAVFTVVLAVATKRRRNTLTVPALQQTLTLTGTVELVALVQTVVVAVTQPVSGHTATVTTAMITSQITHTVQFVAQVSTVVVSVTNASRSETSTGVTAKLCVCTNAVCLVAPVITVIVAVTHQFLRDANSRCAQKVILPAAHRGFPFDLPRRVTGRWGGAGRCRG